MLKRSDKSFVMNGDHIVSESGEYNAAGAKFDYRRMDGPFSANKDQKEGVTEWVTATGPITEPIYVMVNTKQVSLFMHLNDRTDICRSSTTERTPE